jgi:hypothetical protein
MALGSKEKTIFGSKEGKLGHTGLNILTNSLMLRAKQFVVMFAKS